MLNASSFTFNRVCRKADWQLPGFQRWVQELYPDDPLVGGLADPIRKHRKDWEFAVSLLTMDHAGLLTRQRRALGVASGHERILYLLTRHVGEVVGTDLYGETSFSPDEADPTVLA